MGGWGAASLGITQEGGGLSVAGTSQSWEGVGLSELLLSLTSEQRFYTGLVCSKAIARWFSAERYVGHRV